MLPKAPILKTFFMALLAFAVVGAVAEEAANRTFTLRAQTSFTQARQNHLTDTNSAVYAQELARASFDLAELATNTAQRAEIARCGIDASRRLVARKPQSAPGHYYLAMNLGELAEAEAPSIAAYRLVHEVEREFKAAAALDVRFDFAGPARNLGELYFQAPGWPLSVGSNRKAREWLERAVAVAPEYPENQLNLAEAQLKWHQTDLFKATMSQLEAIWPAARTNFTGEIWERSWTDWNVRRPVLKAEFEKMLKRAP